MSWTSVVTVNGFPNSPALISLEDFKEDRAITSTMDDALLTRMILRASTAIARACGRAFVEDSITEIFRVERERYYSPIIDGLPQILLSRWPTSEITSITEVWKFPAETITLESTQWELDPPTGRVLRFSSTSGLPMNWRSREITFEYTGGYAEIPDDLQEACSLTVWDRYNSRTQNRNIKSKFVDGVDRIEYFEPKLSAFLPEVEEILDFYRVPVLR